MILAYGNYRHELAEAGVAIARETVFSPMAVPIATREHWRIDGVLQAETQEALTFAIEELSRAYRLQAQDVVLFLPDGNTPTAHRILSRNTIGGVRVVKPPSFPENKGAEYSTYRSYTIELEAETPVENAGEIMLQWDETLSFTGGGPRWVYLPVLSGPAIKQLVQQQTTYRVTQSGRAVGYMDYPLPAAPIWLDAWHSDSSSVTRKLPRLSGSGSSAVETEFEVTWNYQFESASPLVAQPSRR